MNKGRFKLTSLRMRCKRPVADIEDNASEAIIAKDVDLHNLAELLHGVQKNEDEGFLREVYGTLAILEVQNDSYRTTKKGGERNGKEKMPVLRCVS